MIAVCKKLIKDASYQKLSILMILLAMIIASAGSSSIYYAYWMTKKDFEVNFKASNPADLVLHIQGLQKEDKLFLQQIKEVESIEIRQVVSGNIIVDSNDYMPVILFGIEDFQNIQLDKVSFPEKNPEEFDIYLEQNGAHFLTEDALRSTKLFIYNDTLSFGAAGMVHDGRLPPSTMEHTIYAYCSLAKFQSLISTNSARILVKTNLVNPSIQDLEIVLKDIQLAASQKGIHILDGNIPPPGEHPHQNIADGIFFLLRNFGLSIASMGLIIFVLLILIWLYPQLPDIGRLKAIGLSSKYIIGGYFLFFSLGACITLIIALPIGYGFALAINAFIAMTQNFVPVAMPISLWQHLGVIALCYGVILLAASLPIIQTAKISVREAQQKVFQAPDWLRISGFQRAKHSYVISKLFQNPLVSFLILILIAFGTALMQTGANLKLALEREINDIKLKSPYEFQYTFNTISNGKAHQIFPSIAKAITAGRLGSTSFISPSKGILVQASFQHLPLDFHVDQSLLIQGNLPTACENCIYINQRLQGDFVDLTIGDTLSLMDENGKSQEYIYAGILKRPAEGASFYQFHEEVSSWNKLYIDVDVFREKVPVQSSFNQIFANAGYTNPHVLDLETRLKMVQDHLEGSFYVIIISGLLTLLLSLLSMGLYLKLILLQREREFGIMKSLGNSFQQIRKLLQWEFIFILFSALLLGIAISFYLTKGLGRLFGEMVLHIPIPSATDIPMLILIIIISTLLIWQGIHLISRPALQKSIRKLMDRPF